MLIKWVFLYILPIFFSIISSSLLFFIIWNYKSLNDYSLMASWGVTMISIIMTYKFSMLFYLIKIKVPNLQKNWILIYTTIIKIDEVDFWWRKCKIVTSESKDGKQYISPKLIEPANDLMWKTVSYYLDKKNPEKYYINKIEKSHLWES